MDLNLRDIKKSYGEGDSRQEVLRGLSVELKAGDICVLLGPSGSGKSTLLNIIAGIKVIYYAMMKAFTGWLTFYVAPWGVPFLIVTGIACYFLVNFIIMRRIRKIPMADALKDVE